MAIFTIKVKDRDAEMVLAILKKLKVKVIKPSKESRLTLEIAAALKEVKLMGEGKLKPLTLQDI